MTRPPRGPTLAGMKHTPAALLFLCALPLSAASCKSAEPMQQTVDAELPEIRYYMVADT